jgi:hypothetical protein
MDQVNGTITLKAAAAYAENLLGRNVSGVFTVVDGTTQATLINLRPSYAADDLITCVPLTGVSTPTLTGSKAIAAHTLVYQAAGGKITDSSANSALLVGMTGHENISADGGRGLVIRAPR